METSSQATCNSSDCEPVELVRNGPSKEHTVGYGENAVENTQQKWIRETIESLMENDEYNGRRRTPAEKWDLYKRLRVVATRMYEAMVAEDEARQAMLSEKQRNIEAALAREESGAIW